HGRQGRHERRRRGRRAMKRLALLLVALAACGGEKQSDTCARALDRLMKECPDVMVKSTSGGTDTLNCTGSAECAANCLITTPCSDIKNNAAPFTTCLNACK